MFVQKDLANTNVLNVQKTCRLIFAKNHLIGTKIRFS